MKTRTILKIAVILIFVILLFAILIQFQPRKRKDSLADYKPDGLEMRYVAFNKENQKSLEITSTESEKQDDNTTLLQNIRATVFKKGKLDQEIYISGNRGYAYHDINSFVLEQNVKITSEDLDITCDNFTIKSKHKLFTKDVVNYRARNLKGIARKGMEYYIKVNFIKLFDTTGTHSSDNKEFLYRTDELLIIDRNTTVVFETNTEIKEEKTVMTSDHLVLNFTSDFEQIKLSTSQKNSYLFREDRAKNETMEIRSNFLQADYNKEGKMKTAVARKDARMDVTSRSNHTIVTSPFIKMRFNPQSGQLISSKISPGGNVSCSGRRNFTISAHKIDLTFKEGDVVYGEGIRNCTFKIDNYTGQSRKMTYDVPKNTIHLIGEESEIKTDQNRFISDDFVINTQKDLLTSDAGIKSILVPEGQDFLFSTDSIFVKAKIIEIHNRKNNIIYRDTIRLQQNETIMTCDELEVREKNRMNSKGNVSLSFKEKDNNIHLKGDRISFDPKEKRITITGKGIMKNKSRVLKADWLQISFNDQNELDTIRGKKNIQFINEGIQGTSKKVNWKYPAEMMVFSDSAQIKNRNQGITKGKELKLDLKNSKITILSGAENRSETVIQE